jgi:hypothetical protein
MFLKLLACDVAVEVTGLSRERFDADRGTA